MMGMGIPLVICGAVFWGLVATAVGVLFFACGISFIKDNKTAQKLYQTNLQRYQNANEIYIEAQKKSKLEFDNALQIYNNQYGEYTERKSKTVGQHNNALHLLTKALEEHYSQGIVFPKYRNLVAISAIDEYLSSGRCEKLEGAEGAYNLYEMELRQNIVIGQLSSIINNLEKIKNNQYSLYHELTQANNTVNKILAEVRNISADTCLTAYFAKVAAIAASAPCYTVSL